MRIRFFFSSRRRHTRLQGDWSSDVCSSDLADTSSPRRGRAPDMKLRLTLTQRLSLVDRKSTRLNSSHLVISYAVFCLKKKKKSTRSHGREPHTMSHDQSNSAHSSLRRPLAE